MEKCLLLFTLVRIFVIKRVKDKGTYTKKSMT